MIGEEFLWWSDSESSWSATGTVPIWESGQTMMSKVPSIFYNTFSEKIIRHLREVLFNFTSNLFPYYMKLKVQKSLPDGRSGIVAGVGTTYRTSGVRQHRTSQQ